ncbi:MAG: NUDIX domain-containing protein [Deltaproteobacteria bacterium]|nr:NUDIX domain-containing protein [Deltaproteobacteria bacterium]
MAKHSAGLLMYRYRDDILEVFLVHPGGPFWAGKDLGAWSIPKGEHGPDETPVDAARREFGEETACPSTGDLLLLTPLRQPSCKVIAAWAFQGDCDAGASRSNTFSLEWPPGSGRRVEFPEVDRTAWFSLDEARAKISRGQLGFLEELQLILAQRPEQARKL